MSKPKRVLLVVLFGFLLYIVIGIFYPLTVEHYSIQDPNLPSAFDGFKILQFSDLHCARYGDNQSQLIKIAKEEAPDVIFFTGDMVDSLIRDVEPALELLNGIKDIAPVFAVSGNHEDALHSVYDKEMLPQLTAAGMIDFDNRTTIFTRDGQNIRLCGVTNPISMNDKISIAGFQKNIESVNFDDTYNILLFHRADVLEYFNGKHFNLIFTGHNHGGQIVLPFVGGLISGGRKWFPKYTSGVYDLEPGMQAIVSRGLGNPRGVIRVYASPDVVSVTLHST